MATGKKWGTLGGGSGKMHKFSGAGAQKPGGSSQEGSGARRGIKPQAGPSNVSGYSTSVVNSIHAGTQTPGQTAAKPSGGNDKFARGGSTKMFGNSGSQRLDGGRTSR